MHKCAETTTASSFASWWRGGLETETYECRRLPFFFSPNLFFSFVMKPKPPCPKCGDSIKVKTVGGGSKTYYRYVCEKPECDPCEWQQRPPHQQTTMAIEVRMSDPAKKKRSGPSKYLCGVCGQRKKGHSCTGYRNGRTVGTIAFVSVEDDECKDAPNPPAALFASTHLPPSACTEGHSPPAALFAHTEFADTEQNSPPSALFTTANVV